MANSLHTSLPALLRRLLLALLLATPFQLPAAEPEPDAGIYIVGSLHELHATVPGFSYANLTRIISAIAPQVAVLETRPDELAGRTQTPGRPEYPRVIWPYLQAHPLLNVNAIEPGGALFEQWVTEATADAERLEKNTPAHAYWQSYQQSLEQLLQGHWRTPAAAHDRVSADLARARYLVNYSLAGESLQRGQERWDAYMIDQALQAVRAHPDQRVLVLVSHRNRHRFEAALRDAQPQRVVDMQSWLQALQGSAGKSRR
jgi:hypothetical protein